MGTFTGTANGDHIGSDYLSFGVVANRGGSVCLNTSRGVSKWLGRSFQAAAGISVGTVVYA